MNIKKTIDILIASEIFFLAILEFISWRLCVTENYTGEVKGSLYLIKIYPIMCTIGFLWVGICKIAKTYRFKLCIYTIIISWIFTFIQFFNLLALLTEFGTDFYDSYIYPVFLYTLIFFGFLIFIRWGSQKHS